MKREILGLLLMLLSILMFCLFVWWGTQDYEHGYAGGIVLIAVGTFFSGMFFVDTRNRDK